MKYRLLVTALAAAAAAPCLAAAPTDPIDAALAPFAKPGSPGCAASAAIDGRTVYERQAGLADIEHDVSITDATVFEIGSTSKQFTAAGVLLLVEDGKLRLTDDIRTYFPELPDYGATVTVDQLLGHTSGIREWTLLTILEGWPRTTRALDQVDALNLLSRVGTLDHRPGTAWAYSNSGYVLLGLLIERVSGQSLNAFFKARLFDPLGMTSTQWRDDFRKPVQGRAIAYQAGKGGFSQLMPFENVIGHAGLLTTTRDMQRWSAALATRKLGAAVTERLWEVGKLPDGKSTGYARGFLVGKYRDYEEIHHPGGTAGYRAQMAYYPALKLSVAVTCNSTGADVVGIAHVMADAYMPATVKAEIPAFTGRFLRPDERAGLYMSDKSGAILDLVSDGNGVQIKNGPPLVIASADSMRLRSDYLTFTSETGFEIRKANGDVETYRRINAVDPTPAYLRPFEGHYASREINADYDVSSEGGTLRLGLRQRPSVSYPLVPATKDVFTAPGSANAPPMIIRFHRDARGKVIAFGVSAESFRDFRFDRQAQ